MLPSGPMIDIGQQVTETRRRIAEAAARAGRDPASVTLMAVAKTVPAATVQAAVDAGLRVLGENRVQEAADKIPAVTGPVSWHLIGRLQSNKARVAAALFHAVHSVDRPTLANRLAEAAAAHGRRVSVYVQVEYARTSEPATQVEQRVRETCSLAAAASSLRLEGLMILPPFDPDPEDARPWFRRLRELRERLERELGIDLPGLSMGMSNDFEVAVEEGATIVRVGSAIFGARRSR